MYPNYTSFCISWCFIFKTVWTYQVLGLIQIKKGRLSQPHVSLFRNCAHPQYPHHPAQALAAMRRRLQHQSSLPEVRQTPPRKAGAGRGFWGGSPPLRLPSREPNGRAAPGERPTAVVPPLPARPSPDRYLSGSSGAPFPSVLLTSTLSLSGTVTETRCLLLSRAPANPEPPW